MGGKYSKSSTSATGIQPHELYTLLGYLTEIYDDVVSTRVSVVDGRNLIQHQLKRLSRYALDPSRVGENNKIFPNDDLLIEIYEKYRDSDGVHAWSLVLQFKTTSKTFKALYGIPGSASVTSSLTSTAGNPSIRSRHQNATPPGTSSRSNNATPPRNNAPPPQRSQQQPQQPRYQQPSQQHSRSNPPSWTQQQQQQQQYQPQQQYPPQQQYSPQQQYPPQQSRGMPSYNGNLQSPTNLPMDNMGMNSNIIDEMSRYSGQGQAPGRAEISVQAQQPDVYEINLSKMQ